MNNNPNIQKYLQELEPLPSSYLKVARQIEAEAGDVLRPVKMAVVSTFTSELLRPYLIVESAARGLKADLHFAPFNQLEQQLLDKASPLYAFQPEVIVIAARLEEIAPHLTARFVRLTRKEIDDEIEVIGKRISGLVAGVRRFSTAKILVFNFAPPALLAAGIADSALEISQSSVVQRLNDQMAAVCKNSPDTFVFGTARMVSEFGLNRWHDAKLFYLGRVPFSLDAQIETARQLARHLRALFFPPCKCLVLDLDNTLWGGVLGEDGIGGIALGEEYPGRVYKDFQRYLLSLRDQGILLAIASKNNEADVLELFQKHSDCVLRLEDFAAHQINWSEKPENLKQIAATLNIGTDALAFFDDNPVERELVRVRMPEVTVIDVPDNPLAFIAAVSKSGAFDRLTVSAEDRKRGAMYSEQRQRESLQTQCASTEDFLKSLEMKVTIGGVNGETLERVAQLLAKTNQFNLTTRRHSAAQITQMIEAGAIALWVRVADRFGDNGLVGVAIALPDPLTPSLSPPDGERVASCRERGWLIDTFLLSCRVIGRQVETALLSRLVHLIRERAGKTVRGQYIPTAKNSLVAEFFPKHGFEKNGDGWALDVSQNEIPFPEFISVTLANEKASVPAV